MCAMLSVEPVRRLSMQTTSQPRARRNSHRWEPMKPAPPVTRTRIGPSSSAGQDGLAPDGVVLEAEPPHALGLIEVAGVEDQRAAQESPQTVQVQVLELVPLGEQGDPVRARGRLVGRLA